MSSLIRYVSRIPPWLLTGAAALFALIIVAYLFSRITKNRRFREEVQQKREDIASHFSRSYFKKHSRFLINLAQKEGNAEILRRTGLNTIWIDEYKKTAT